MGPIPLLAGISMTIAADRGGWRTTFARGDVTIAEERSKAYPWVGKYAAGHLTGVLCEAEPLDKKAVKTAIEEAFGLIAQSDDTAALVSEAAARVIAETVSVKVELSDPPAYVVDLEDGKSLVLSAREIAAHTPLTLNTKWLTVHPREPLNATGADFQQIIEHWLSIAVEVEPTGDGNAWEGVVEALQIKVAPLAVHPTRDGLLKSGLYQEEGGPLWIAGRVIAEAIRESGLKENGSQFSKYLQSTGDLICPSKKVRVGQMLVRVWGFRSGFRPDDPGISEFAALTAEEVRP